MRDLPLRGRSLTSLGLTACRLKTPYTTLCGIPIRLKMAGALILVLLRAITLCRIVVRGILGQFQYYCMFCLVTHIVGSNLKSKNQEVSGFSDQWVLNATVDFNGIWHKCLPTPIFETLKFLRNSKKSKFENFHIQKKVPLLLHRGVQCVPQRYRRLNYRGYAKRSLKYKGRNKDILETQLCFSRRASVRGILAKTKSLTQRICHTNVLR